MRRTGREGIYQRIDPGQRNKLQHVRAAGNRDAYLEVLRATLEEIETAALNRLRVYWEGEWPESLSTDAENESDPTGNAESSGAKQSAALADDCKLCQGRREVYAPTGVGRDPMQWSRCPQCR